MKKNIKFILFIIFINSSFFKTKPNWPTITTNLAIPSIKKTSAIAKYFCESKDNTKDINKNKGLTLNYTKNLEKNKEFIEEIIKNEIFYIDIKKEIRYKKTILSFLSYYLNIKAKNYNIINNMTALSGLAFLSTLRSRKKSYKISLLIVATGMNFYFNIRNHLKL
jgi:hypothetical protein